MVIANTLFQQHKRRLYTWTSPDCQYQNQIDYILCSQRWRSSIQSAKTRLGADCGSDHELLIAKFILECEVKLTFGGITTNKANGADRIPVELFQTLKDDAVKVLHSICQQIWKTQQWPQDWKWSVFTPIPKKGNTKECSNYCTIALISHASKVMLKILQARIQQYMNHELPDVQAGFRKGRRNCQHLLDHSKSKRVPENHLFLLY